MRGEVLAPESNELFHLQEIFGTNAGGLLGGGRKDAGGPSGGKFPARWPSNVNPDGTPRKSALKKRKLDVDDAAIPMEVGALYDEEGEIIAGAQEADDAGWQDGEEYAHQQRELVGDIDDGDGAIVVRQQDAGTKGVIKAPPVRRHQEVEASNGHGVADKEARKPDKKKRRKAEQRAKEEAKAG